MLLENISKIDRIVRFVIGTLMVGAAYFVQDANTLMFAFSLASFYPLLTALTAWDPLYALVLSFLSKEATTTQKV